VGRWLKAEPRLSVTLDTLKVDNPVHGRTLLIGNAAQALHPVAAQGLNLGLRDVKRLIRCLTDVCSHQPWSDNAARTTLTRYLNQRQSDLARTSRLTHRLVTLFSTDVPLLGSLRGLGLALLDMLPIVKQQVFNPDNTEVT